MTKGSKVGFMAATLVVLALATPALAGGKGPGDFAGTREVQVSGEVLFNGQEVPQGTYRLSWEMSGADRVEVRLLKGKRVLATAGGRLVAARAASRYDSLVYTRNGNGKLELAEIRFAGSSSTISLKDGDVGPAEGR